MTKYGCVWLLTLCPALLAAEEFSFDASEYDTKTFEFSGYLEAKQEVQHLQTTMPIYQLSYPNESRDWLSRSTGTLDLSGKWTINPQWLADLHGQASYATDAFETTQEPDKILDGGLHWSADSSLSFDVGKRVQRWGKGYAWNPVGFIERAKDPSDPQTSREGFNMLSGEWTRSYDSTLQMLTITPVVVPTYDELNPDFGSDHHLNPALKLYALAWDTDLDLMWLAKGSKPQSLGFDFSRNLSTNLEIHGEWAHQYGVQQNVLISESEQIQQSKNIDSYLLGIRYLTENEVTWIFEYYHNGRGYDQSVLDQYYDLLWRAIGEDASAQITQKARQLMQSGYNKMNPAQDYLYLRASISEPFDWLYTTPAMTLMTNLHDQSFQITPELSYTGFQNIELRGRLIWLVGNTRTEWGEKLADKRAELYLRWYF